jgi:hypothetical protein
MEAVLSFEKLVTAYGVTTQKTTLAVVLYGFVKLYISL